MISELNTNEEVKVHDMVKVGGRKLWDEKSIADYSISDKSIEKRIDSYKEQDRKAGREVVELTLEQVRTLKMTSKESVFIVSRK